jgi:hypothetical protein
LWAAALGQTGADRIRVDRLRADIAFLASAPLEGRRSLERGSEVAIQFVAAEFAKAGLKPAAGQSYLQEFPVVEYRLKPDGRRLKMTVGGRERERASGPSSQALAESDRRIPAITVSDAVAAELLPPTGKKPGELQARIDASLRPASEALAGASVEMAIEVAESRRATSANVVGVLERSDPKLRGQAVLFTAHYDHLGIRDGKVLPGADDDASGTAAVIELARVFAQDPERTKRTLVFIAFGGEEAGLLGSYYYAAHPLAATRAVINLDMIGRDEKPSTQTNGLIEIAADTSNELNFIGLKSSPGLRAVLERANRGVGLRLSYKWDDDAALNVLWRGDQFPFLLKGVPAVWLFNGFQPDYHTPSDTIDKLNFTKMVKIVRLAYLAGRALANQ